MVKLTHATPVEVWQFVRNNRHQSLHLTSLQDKQSGLVSITFKYIFPVQSDMNLTPQPRCLALWTQCWYDIYLCILRLSSPRFVSLWAPVNKQDPHSLFSPGLSQGLPSPLIYTTKTHQCYKSKGKPPISSTAFSPRLYLVFSLHPQLGSELAKEQSQSHAVVCDLAPITQQKEGNLELSGL